MPLSRPHNRYTTGRSWIGRRSSGSDMPLLGRRHTELRAMASGHRPCLSTQLRRAAHQGRRPTLDMGGTPAILSRRPLGLEAGNLPFQTLRCVGPSPPSSPPAVAMWLATPGPAPRGQQGCHLGRCRSRERAGPSWATATRRTSASEHQTCHCASGPLRVHAPASRLRPGDGAASTTMRL